MKKVMRQIEFILGSKFFIITKTYFVFRGRKPYYLAEDTVGNRNILMIFIFLLISVSFNLRSSPGDNVFMEMDIFKKIFLK